MSGFFQQIEFFGCFYDVVCTVKRGGWAGFITVSPRVESGDTDVTCEIDHIVVCQYFRFLGCEFFYAKPAACPVVGISAYVTEGG